MKVVLSSIGISFLIPHSSFLILHSSFLFLWFGGCCECFLIKGGIEPLSELEAYLFKNTYFDESLLLMHGYAGWVGSIDNGYYAMIILLCGSLYCFGQKDFANALSAEIFVYIERVFDGVFVGGTNAECTVGRKADQPPIGIDGTNNGIIASGFCGKPLPHNVHVPTAIIVKGSAMEYCVVKYVENCFGMTEIAVDECYVLHAMLCFEYVFVYTLLQI